MKHQGKKVTYETYLTAKNLVTTNQSIAHKQSHIILYRIKLVHQRTIRSIPTRNKTTNATISHRCNKSDSIFFRFGYVFGVITNCNNPFKSLVTISPWFLFTVAFDRSWNACSIFSIWAIICSIFSTTCFVAFWSCNCLRCPNWLTKSWRL